MARSKVYLGNKVASGPPPSGSTVYVKVAGVWVLATVYVKVAGVWQLATPSVKVSGAWH